MPRKIARAMMCATMMLACDDPAPAPPPAPATRNTPVPSPAPAPESVEKHGVILFLGTSLTAGYGIGAEHAFPAVIQQKLDSAHLPFRVRNAGLSGETSAGGLRRLDWSLQEPIDVLVLELGANDGLRGLPVSQLRANLDSIIVLTRARYPDAQIIIAGMEAPPNLGGRYTEEFRSAYKSIARRRNAQLLPFLLDGVAANAELNQEDGIHPNADGHRRIAENLWSVLEPALRVRIKPRSAPATIE